MVNILISGYYGFDNIGDESILRTLVSSLREHIPDCSLTVLSHNPASTREKYGVEAVDRMSPVAILRAVKKCDMLISGGGSLLQDVTSSKSLHYYLSIIRCAEFFHKKVFIYSQGIGPIDRPGNRRAAAAALKRADGIVVRDERSASLLEEIGIARDKVVITADPVIRMKKPDGDVGAEILRKAGVSLDGRLTVGWAIRERDTDSRFVKELLRSIQMMKDKYNAQSVLIPFHYEEDGEVCRHIAAQLPDDTAVCLNEKYLSEDMLSIIGNMDLLVGVRLHSLIYAAIMGVPLIGISYDPKCTAFLNSVGLDKLSTKENFTAELFLPEAERVLETGKEQVQCVEVHMVELSRKLDTNEKMICTIMEKSRKHTMQDPQNNTEKKDKSGVRTAGAISFVFLLTLFAKLLGVVREMMQANIFGTGIDADLYTASYNSTLYLFTTMCYALCIAAVPILTKEFAADRKADYVGTYFKTALVTVLTTSIFLFCYLIDTATATALNDSAVSAFYYADKLFTPLTTSVLYSISAVMFPRFNREFTKEDSKGYLGYIWNVTENTLLFILPVCAMMCAFGTDIIRVIFESGSFTAESTEMTGSIFARYALGMSAFAVLDLLNKAYYAMKKTLVPLLINLGVLVLNLILNRVFYTDTGVALATSLALTIGAIAMTIQLFHGTKIVRLVPLLKGLAATAAMAVVLYGGRSLLVAADDSKLMLVVKCGLTGVVGCVIYVLVSMILKQKIIADTIKKFKK